MSHGKWARYQCKKGRQHVVEVSFLWGAAENLECRLKWFRMASWMTSCGDPEGAPALGLPATCAHPRHAGYQGYTQRVPRHSAFRNVCAPRQAGHQRYPQRAMPHSFPNSDHQRQWWGGRPRPQPAPWPAPRSW